MKNLFVFIFLGLSLALRAQVNPVDANNVAIGGYDVVSYFEANKAEAGNATFASKFEQVTYYFTSAGNKKLFDASPAKYIPEYGGYCALAVSYGKKISIDPKTYKITNGKLYLFFNGKTNRGKINSIETWNRNEERLLKKADSNWPGVKKSKYKPEDTL